MITKKQAAEIGFEQFKRNKNVYHLDIEDAMYLIMEWRNGGHSIELWVERVHGDVFAGELKAFSINELKEKVQKLKDVFYK